MAYLSMVDYDEGGSIRSLDGFLGEVTYDTGTTRNLLGANLSTVKYDDGGRFRTLVGLGQDDSIDLPLTPPDSTNVPIMYEPPTPSPVFDTVSASIPGTLIPPSAGPTPPIFYTPMPTVDTVSTPVPGTLVDTSGPAPGAPAVQTPQTASVLTSIFNGVRNIFSSTAHTVTPLAPGTVLPTVPATGSWFSQPSVLGVPNWGLLAGVGVGGILLMSAMGGSGGGGGSRRRNPSFSGRAASTARTRRRKNPMELILMGANPRRRWR